MLLWKQWHAIGATASVSGHAQSIVDVDALILMSLWMQEHERRLLDVMTSWIRLNSSLLSIQRLGNLRDDFPSSIRPRLELLAAFGVKQCKDIRWKSLMGKSQAEELGERDNKSRAVEARISSWAALQLRMRKGMGVGAKADTLTFLLGTPPHTEWVSVSSIAEAIGYTAAAVRRVADDLADAGFIRMPASRIGDRLQRMYNADRQRWGNLLVLHPHDPGWGYWRERYLFLIEFLESSEKLEGLAISDYARDVWARDLLTKHAQVFTRDRVVDSAEFATAELNDDFLAASVRRFVYWMANSG